MPPRMTDASHTERPARATDERAASIAQRYREHAPRAPETGLDLFEIFSSNDEIEMEIGFGRGLFLQQRAVSAPRAQLLGLEIKHKLAYQVAERCQRLGLARVRVMAGDARVVLPRVRPDAALARVFILFPDPWWKKRHAKRRVVSEDVLDQIARLLRPGGELFIETDVEERLQEALDQLREHPGFVLRNGGLIDHNPFGARSNREQRAIADGLPIYRILATRAG
jgi:tRNA (guanine-N7-)-methyltransferase